jgi:hypothetical protein
MAKLRYAPYDLRSWLRILDIKPASQPCALRICSKCRSLAEWNRSQPLTTSIEQERYAIKAPRGNIDPIDPLRKVVRRVQ